MLMFCHFWLFASHFIFKGITKFTVSLRQLFASGFLLSKTFLFPNTSNRLSSLKSWLLSIIILIRLPLLTTISRFQYTGIFNNLIIVSKYIFGVRWCFGAIAYQVIILSSPVDRCFRDLIYSNVILMPF